MPNGKQWIHMDAQFPLGFGHELSERFGPLGQLLFIQFLCACKRSFPQGQIRYRTEDELRLLLGAHFDFVDSAGDKWSLDEFWRWCGKRKVTRTKTVGTRKHVYATRWDTWEDERKAKNAERMRRSRAGSVRARARLRGEVGGMRGEVVGGSAEGDVAGLAAASGPVPRHARGAAQELINKLVDLKAKAEE